MAEFAIVLPAMLLMLLGSVEVAQMVEAHRRVTRAASTVADIVAQNREVDAARLTDIFRAADLMLAPLPAETLGVRVSSFVADDKGKVAVEWAEQKGTYAGSAPANSLGTYKLQENQSVIVADVSYRYDPILQWVLPDEIAMQKRMILRPRIAEKVELKTKT